MKLIAGKIKCDPFDKVRFWAWGFDHEPKGYAIVENLDDYALVKIIGTVETDYPNELTGHRKLKRAVLSVPTKLLEMAESEQIEPAKRFLNEVDVKLHQYQANEEFWKGE